MFTYYEKIIKIKIFIILYLYKMSAFGSGSISNGNFWYGNSTNFPGFLYKKNVGVGGRRSTKFNPGGNTTCNGSNYLYNKYKPGTGGVGASSIATRRAKNRLASICNANDCFPYYMTLGQYSNYTHNPNGFINMFTYTNNRIAPNQNSFINTSTSANNRISPNLK